MLWCYKVSQLSLANTAAAAAAIIDFLSLSRRAGRPGPLLTLDWFCHRTWGASGQLNTLQYSYLGPPTMSALSSRSLSVREYLRVNAITSARWDPSPQWLALSPTPRHLTAELGITPNIKTDNIQFTFQDCIYFPIHSKIDFEWYSDTKMLCKNF